jgi:hypothetical protein
MNGIIIENFEYILNNIKNICDYHLIINNNILNYSIYGYELGNSTDDYFLENNLMFINFENIKKEIIKKYNLDNNTNIYALILDSQNEYNNSSTNDLSFKLFLENGTELNISDMKELEITVSMPMTNIDLLNYDYAVHFSEQGYDIYNSKSDFYNDRCTSAHINKNDITVKDRKDEIYPNSVILDKTNCEYINADLNNKRLNYNCSFNAEIYNNEISTDEDNENDIQDNNFFKYFLDLINYKIVICLNLLFKNENYINNYGFMFCTLDVILGIIFLIMFFIFDFQKMRVNLFKEIPTKLIHLQKNRRSTKNNNTKKIVNTKRNIKNNDVNKKKKENKEKKNFKINKKEKGIKKKVKKNEPKKKENNKFKKKGTKCIKIKKSNPIKKLKININNNKNKKKIQLSENLKNSSFNNLVIYNTNIINMKNSKINRNTKKYDNKNINYNIFNLNKKKQLIRQITINTKIKSKNNIIKKYKEEKFNNDDYDEMPFTKAVKLDKRNIFKIFIYKLIEKIEILDIILFKKIKNILFTKYISFLLIDFFFNSFLYTDNVVSHKSHNNRELDFYVSVSLTLLSNFISSIIEYYFNRLINFEIKYNTIYEIRKECMFLLAVKNYFRQIKIRTTLFIIEESLIIVYCSYYITVFCAIYKNTQKSLIKNYIMSIIEELILDIIIAFVIVSTRKFGLFFKNKYLYNSSKYIDQHF